MSTVQYSILGLSAHINLTERDVTTAYRKLSLRYHPDKAPDDPDAALKFCALNDAYEAVKKSIISGTKKSARPGLSRSNAQTKTKTPQQEYEEYAAEAENASRRAAETAARLAAQKMRDDLSRADDARRLERMERAQKEADRQAQEEAAHWAEVKAKKDAHMARQLEKQRQQAQARNNELLEAQRRRQQATDNLYVPSSHPKPSTQNGGYSGNHQYVFPDDPSTLDFANLYAFGGEATSTRTGQYMASFEAAHGSVDFGTLFDSGTTTSSASQTTKVFTAGGGDCWSSDNRNSMRDDEDPRTAKRRGHAGQTPDSAARNPGTISGQQNSQFQPGAQFHASYYPHYSQKPFPQQASSYPNHDAFKSHHTNSYPDYDAFKSEVIYGENQESTSFSQSTKGPHDSFQAMPSNSGQAHVRNVQYIPSAESGKNLRQKLYHPPPGIPKEFTQSQPASSAQYSFAYTAEPVNDPHYNFQAEYNPGQYPGAPQEPSRKYYPVPNPQFKPLSEDNLRWNFDTIPPTFSAAPPYNPENRARQTGGLSPPDTPKKFTQSHSASSTQYCSTSVPIPTMDPHYNFQAGFGYHQPTTANKPISTTAAEPAPSTRSGVPRNSSGYGQGYAGANHAVPMPTTNNSSTHKFNFHDWRPETVHTSTCNFDSPGPKQSTGNFNSAQFKSGQENMRGGYGASRMQDENRKFDDGDDMEGVEYERRDKRTFW